MNNDINEFVKCAWELNKGSTTGTNAPATAYPSGASGLTPGF